MNISVRNNDKRTHIEVFEGDVNCEFNTDEIYDANGVQHIPSAVINTTGFNNPIQDRQIIIRELTRKGFIVDNT